MRRAVALVSAWTRSAKADAVLALALAAEAMLEIWWPGGAIGAESALGDKPVLVVTMLAATLPLALRRRVPLVVLCVVVAALATQALLTVFLEGLAGLVALLVAVYSVAAHASRPRALVGLAVALAGSLPLGEDAADFAYSAIVLSGTWLVGRALRTARQRAQELAALAAQLEHEREERARLAVAEERARIARELHDVVAHGVSTMVVQAEAGEALLEREPAQARESLRSIQATGREALVEMRRLLGLLRREPEPALAPQPGLADLDRLVEQMGKAGLPVELEIVGEPRTVAPGLDLSAYRIVQEALTNALNHAGPARAYVTVRYRERELELEITDDGLGETGAGQGGHGLTGMRERVRLYGGELQSGARSGGGYAVRARLPLEA